jgi:hypothetical protein
LREMKMRNGRVFDVVWRGDAWLRTARHLATPQVRARRSLDPTERFFEHAGATEERLLEGGVVRGRRRLRRLRMMKMKMMMMRKTVLWGRDG